jgi:hypothetical protein
MNKETMEKTAKTEIENEIDSEHYEIAVGKIRLAYSLELIDWNDARESLHKCVEYGICDSELSKYCMRGFSK